MASLKRTWTFAWSKEVARMMVCGVLLPNALTLGFVVSFFSRTGTSDVSSEVLARSSIAALPIVAPSTEDVSREDADPGMISSLQARINALYAAADVKEKTEARFEAERNYSIILRTLAIPPGQLKRVVELLAQRTQLHQICSEIVRAEVSLHEDRRRIQFEALNPFDENLRQVVGDEGFRTFLAFWNAPEVFRTIQTLEASLLVTASPLSEDSLATIVHAVALADSEDEAYENVARSLNNPQSEVLVAILHSHVQYLEMDRMRGEIYEETR